MVTLLEAHLVAPAVTHTALQSLCSLPIYTFLFL